MILMIFAFDYTFENYEYYFLTDCFFIFLAVLGHINFCSNLQNQNAAIQGC